MKICQIKLLKPNVTALKGTCITFCDVLDVQLDYDVDNILYLKKMKNREKTTNRKQRGIKIGFFYQHYKYE